MSRRIHYFALAVLLVAAGTYQVRYTLERMPAWFSKDWVAAFPFLVVPDSRASQFTVYLLPGGSAAGLRNGQVVSAINGKPLKGTAVFGDALRSAGPGD